MSDIVYRLRMVDPGQVLLMAPPFDTSYLHAGLLCHEAATEIERLRADAARYRYLKDRAESYDGYACFPDVRYVAPIPDCSPFCPVDAAVDAAIAEERKP